MQQYELAWQCKHEKCWIANFECRYKVILLISKFSFEKQMRDFYSSTIFLLFQGDLKKLINFKASRDVTDDQVYFVEEFDGHDQQVHAVSFDSGKVMLTCDCCLFETKGILCCHSIAGLMECGIHEIPSTCIIEWWKKDINVTYVPRKPKSYSQSIDPYIRHQNVR